MKRNVFLSFALVAIGLTAGVFLGRSVDVPKDRQPIEMAKQEESLQAPKVQQKPLLPENADYKKGLAAYVKDFVRTPIQATVWRDERLFSAAKDKPGAAVINKWSLAPVLEVGIKFTNAAVADDGSLIAYLERDEANKREKITLVDVSAKKTREFVFERYGTKFSSVFVLAVGSKNIALVVDHHVLFLDTLNGVFQPEILEYAREPIIGPTGNHVAVEHFNVDGDGFHEYPMNEILIQLMKGDTEIWKQTIKGWNHSQHFLRDGHLLLVYQRERSYKYFCAFTVVSNTGTVEAIHSIPEQLHIASAAGDSAYVLTTPGLRSPSTTLWRLSKK